MKRYIVLNPHSSLYMPEKGQQGVPMDEAKIFRGREAARKAGAKWNMVSVVREIEFVQSKPAPPSATPNMSGVWPIPFKMAVDYFRSVYFTDITKSATSESESIYNVPLLPYLESHNRFLRILDNGDQLIVKFSDFENCHPSLRPFARELLEVFGTTDDEGNTFCLFIIDWKDEKGEIKVGY